ncbi:MAG: prolyl oligopeptidase family serine peptidase [Flavobacteriaceae bacterium]
MEGAPGISDDTTIARPYGTWPSPLGARDCAAGAVRLADLTPWRGGLAWVEGRPAEGGRCAVVWNGGEGPRDIAPAPFSARSRVHEYGGAALFGDGERLFFVNDADQDIYEIAGDAPRRVSAAPAWRFADGDLHKRTILAIGEREVESGHPLNGLVAIDANGDAGAPAIVAEGRDFYAAPRLSPDGGSVCWLAWDLPHMPWEAAEIWLGDWDGRKIASPRRIGGGAGEPAFQPEWSAEGALHAVIERDGVSAPMVFDGRAWRDAGAPGGEWFRPLWGLGERSFVTAPAGVGGLPIVDGVASVAFPGARDARSLERAGIASASAPRMAGGGLAVIATRHLAAPAVMRLAAAGDAVAVSDSGAAPDPSIVSMGEPVSLDTPSGPVHAIHYPPVNAGFRGLAGELPPMIASAHGGPTGAADRGLKYKIQFWTSRGFAFLDVDYRGSTGYGAAYRRALDGEWGIADADDLAHAATAAAARGLADPKRLLASGSSAGGYSVLQALVRHDFFAAATSIYGVADPQRLMEITHKFEAGYFDSLFGLAGGSAIPPERIPSLHADAIECPMLFLQGADDRVVPPEQSRGMAERLKSAGRRVAYREFAGEGHGFRRGETVSAALETEYAFYASVLGLDIPDAAGADLIDPYWL